MPTTRSRLFAAVNIDPPWPFVRGFNGWGRRRPLPYRAMSVEAIAALPVADVVAREGYAFVWTTNHHLPPALAILPGWGLCFRQLVTWAKPEERAGLGGLFGSNTEHVIVAQRIRPGTNAHGRRTRGERVPRCWFDWPVGEHSVKPDEWFGLVERLLPGPYLDVFARRRRPGWTCVGDAIDGADAAEALRAIVAAA